MDWNLPEILDVEFLTDKEVEELIKIKANIDDIYTKLETDNKIIEKLQPYITSDAINTKYTSKDLLNTKLDLYLLKSEAGTTYVNKSQLSSALSPYIKTSDAYTNFTTKDYVSGQISTCVPYSSAYSTFVTMGQYNGQYTGVQSHFNDIEYYMNIYTNNAILLDTKIDANSLSNTKYTFSNCAASTNFINIGTTSSIGSMVLNDYVTVDNNCIIEINNAPSFDILTDTNRKLNIDISTTGVTLNYINTTDSSVIATTSDTTLKTNLLKVKTVILNNQIKCTVTSISSSSTATLTLSNDDILNNFNKVKLSFVSDGKVVKQVGPKILIYQPLIIQDEVQNLQSRVTALEQGLTTLDTYLKS